MRAAPPGVGAPPSPWAGAGQSSTASAGSGERAAFGPALAVAQRGLPARRAPSAQDTDPELARPLPNELAHAAAPPGAQAAGAPPSAGGEAQAGDPTGRAIDAAFQLCRRGPAEVELCFGADLRYALTQGPAGVEIQVRSPAALEERTRCDLRAVAEQLRRQGVRLARAAILPAPNAGRHGARSR